VATLLTSPPDQKQRAGGEQLDAGAEGDAQTWRLGDVETWRRGDVETWSETGRLGGRAMRTVQATGYGE